MQAAQATVQGKSKRLPQGRKYLNALKNRTNDTNYENAKTPRRRRGVLLSGDQIFVTILMPGPMVDAVTQERDVLALRSGRLGLDDGAEQRVEVLG